MNFLGFGRSVVPGKPVPEGKVLINPKSNTSHPAFYTSTETLQYAEFCPGSYLPKSSDNPFWFWMDITFHQIIGRNCACFAVNNIVQVNKRSLVFSYHIFDTFWVLGVTTHRRQNPMTSNFSNFFSKSIFPTQSHPWESWIPSIDIMCLK